MQRIIFQFCFVYFSIVKHVPQPYPQPYPVQIIKHVPQPVPVHIERPVAVPHVKHQYVLKPYVAPIPIYIQKVLVNFSIPLNLRAHNFLI